MKTEKLSNISTGCLLGVLVLFCISLINDSNTIGTIMVCMQWCLIGIQLMAVAGTINNRRIQRGEESW